VNEQNSGRFYLLTIWQGFFRNSKTIDMVLYHYSTSICCYFSKCYCASWTPACIASFFLVYWF